MHLFAEGVNKHHLYPNTYMKEHLLYEGIFNAKSSPARETNTWLAWIATSKWQVGMSLHRPTITLANLSFVHEQNKFVMKLLSPANCSKICFVAGYLHPTDSYRLKLNLMWFAAVCCTCITIAPRIKSRGVLKYGFSYFCLYKHLKGTQSCHTSVHRWTCLSLCPKAIAVETISSAIFLGMRTSSLPPICSLFGTWHKLLSPHSAKL